MIHKAINIIYLLHDMDISSKSKCEYSLNKRIPSILPHFLPLFIIIGIIKQKQDYKICEPTFLPQFGEISGFRLALWIIRSLECSSDKIKFDSF